MNLRAERGTIYLGDIEINAYLLSNGEYCLAGRNVTDAVGEPNNSLTRLFNVGSLKDLPHKGLSLIQVKADSGETFIPVALEDVIEYWFEMSCRGNAKAKLLSKALMAETLESRLDNFFGIKRSQEEKDKRLQARLLGKATRRLWTDATRDYMLRHAELSDNARNWMYKSVTDKLYKLLFHKNAKQLRELLSCTNPRDSLSARDLQEVERIEALATKLIDGMDMHPITAIENAFRLQMMVSKEPDISIT